MYVGKTCNAEPHLYLPTFLCITHLTDLLKWIEGCFSFKFSKETAVKHVEIWFKKSLSIEIGSEQREKILFGKDRKKKRKKEEKMFLTNI